MFVNVYMLSLAVLLIVFSVQYEQWLHYVRQMCGQKRGNRSASVAEVVLP